jgi:hypothetical protein
MADSSDHTTGAGSEIVAQNPFDNNPGIRCSHTGKDNGSPRHVPQCAGLGWAGLGWAGLDRFCVGKRRRHKAKRVHQRPYGLCHVLGAKQRKDGLSESETTGLLGNTVNTIASGEEFSRYEVNGRVRVGGGAAT